MMKTRYIHIQLTHCTIVGDFRESIGLEIFTNICGIHFKMYVGVAASELQMTRNLQKSQMFLFLETLLTDYITIVQ